MDTSDKASPGGHDYVRNSFVRLLGGGAARKAPRRKVAAAAAPEPPDRGEHPELLDRLHLDMTLELDLDVQIHIHIQIHIQIQIQISPLGGQRRHPDPGNANSIFPGE